MGKAAYFLLPTSVARWKDRSGIWIWDLGKGFLISHFALFHISHTSHTLHTHYTHITQSPLLDRLHYGLSRSLIEERKGGGREEDEEAKGAKGREKRALHGPITMQKDDIQAGNSCK
jgi:hypothetical protein